MLLAVIFAGCNSPIQQEGGLSQKEAAPVRHQQEINRRAEAANSEAADMQNIIKLAQAKFDAYLPKIEKTNNAGLDGREAYTGDFTGDGLEDVAIYFVLTPKEGGNAIVGQGLTLYQNTGNDVKVIAGFEPDYMFSFRRIENGKIYIEKLAYAETDGHCCPSIKENRVLTVSGNKIRDEKE